MTKIKTKGPAGFCERHRDDRTRLGKRIGQIEAVENLDLTPQEAAHLIVTLWHRWRMAELTDEPF